MSDMQSLIERLGVHPALGPIGEGWNIEQNPYELAEFLAQLPEIKTVLEIGTGYRAGLARFMSYHLGWRVSSVDINVAAEHPALLVNPQKQDYFFHGSSATFAQMLNHENIEHRWDLLVIDGDHTYEAVKADYDNFVVYTDKVVMFHDIAGLRDCEGVEQFWKELAYTKAGKLRKGFYEIIDDTEFRSGIGWWLK